MIMNYESKKSDIVDLILKEDLKTQRFFIMWASELVSISESNMTKMAKARSAISCTLDKKILFSLIKIISSKIKQYGWDKRSNRSKAALIAGGIGFTVFSGQSAGIAALGGAIGVPLWVVLGGGAAFLVVIIEDIKSRSNIQNPRDSVYMNHENINK